MLPLTHKHSWSWYRTWLFWKKPAKRCGKCHAMLRMEPAGPRGGKRYFYHDSHERAYRQVAYLPPCFGSPLEVPEPREEIVTASKLMEPPK